MLKSLTSQLILAAIVLGLLFFLWPGFTTTLAIGVGAGMVLANISPTIEAFVEGLIKKATGGN